jgi:adenosine deaminase
VQEAFDLSVDEWETICRASIRGSWCSDQRKEEMAVKLKEVLDGWKASSSQ